MEQLWSLQQYITNHGFQPEHLPVDDDREMDRLITVTLQGLIYAGFVTEDDTTQSGYRVTPVGKLVILCMLPATPSAVLATAMTEREFEKEDTEHGIEWLRS